MERAVVAALSTDGLSRVLLPSRYRNGFVVARWTVNVTSADSLIRECASARQQYRHYLVHGAELDVEMVWRTFMSCLTPIAIMP